jgi:hypothetical protein
VPPQAMALAKQRELAAAARVADMTAELDAARARATALEAAATELRARVAAGPDSSLRDAIASLQAENRAQAAALAAAEEDARAERGAKDTLRVQVWRESRICASTTARHMTLAVATARLMSLRLVAPLAHAGSAPRKGGGEAARGGTGTSDGRGAAAARGIPRSGGYSGSIERDHAPR